MIRTPGYHRLLIMPLALKIILFASLLGWAGCNPEAPRDRFPAGFLFGGATSGFQMEMGCPTLPKWLCADENSDWYQFTTSEEMIAAGSTHLSGEDPAVTGPGFWELYEEDFDRLAYELGEAVQLRLQFLDDRLLAGLRPRPMGWRVCRHRHAPPDDQR